MDKVVHCFFCGTVFPENQECTNCSMGGGPPEPPLIDFSILPKEIPEGSVLWVRMPRNINPELMSCVGKHLRKAFKGDSDILVTQELKGYDIVLKEKIADHLFSDKEKGLLAHKWLEKKG